MFRLGGDMARDNKGAVFNLVFSFLILAVGPWYIQELKKVKEFGDTNFMIAFLLLLAFIAEPWALYIKIKSVYANADVRRDLTGRFVYLWMAHCVVTVLTTLTMAYAMPGPMKWINMPVFWIIGARELVFLFFLLGLGIVTYDEEGKETKPRKKFTDKQVFWADAALSVYAFLAFGVTWQSVGATGFLQGTMNELADSVLFRLFTYTFMFFMLYYPIRLGQFIEEWLVVRTKEQKRNYRLSLLITMASCIGPLFVGASLPDAGEINLPDRTGKTPLLRAVEYEPLNYLERLIEAGADINAQDTSGKSALHYAAEGGRYEALELLLQSGANPNIRGKSGGTPLALTAGFHHAQAMEILLKYKADPNIPYYDGQTPLMVAAYQGFDAGAVKLLLKYKARASQQDTSGWCAISYFSHTNNIVDDEDSTILALLIKNTDLGLRDKDGHTLVWHAMRYNGWPYTDVAGALIKAGAAFDSSDIINLDGWNLLESRYMETGGDSASE